MCVLIFMKWRFSMIELIILTFRWIIFQGLSAFEPPFLFSSFPCDIFPSRISQICNIPNVHKGQVIDFWGLSAADRMDLQDLGNCTFGMLPTSPTSLSHSYLDCLLVSIPAIPGKVNAKRKNLTKKSIFEKFENPPVRNEKSPQNAKLLPKTIIGNFLIFNFKQTR